MSPKQSPVKQSVSRPNQQGSMLVIALFVIIVLGLLGITMTRLLSSSSETVVYEVLGQRALNAAKSGINCAVANQFATACTQSTNHTFTNIAGLENCAYTVNTSQKTIDDGATTPFDYWTFSSTGQCTAGNITVTRIVYVDAML